MKSLLLATFKLINIFIFVLVFLTSSNAQTPKRKIVDPRKFVEEICLQLQSVSNTKNIPPAFLARLIWKESRFDPNAVSPKGAQGIAQFMPATARERGLSDPFEPLQSIEASASYLVDLKAELGSWGMAAGGYNAGPNRIKAWLLGLSTLPFETRDYISAITGHTAQEWISKNFKEPKFSLKSNTGFLKACNGLPSKNWLYLNASLDERLAPIQAWGVILTSHFSRQKAMAIFERLQKRFPRILKDKKPSIARRVNRSFGSKARYEIQLGASSRQKANQLCLTYKIAGGSCIVLRN